MVFGKPSTRELELEQQVTQLQETVVDVRGELERSEQLRTMNSATLASNRETIDDLRSQLEHNTVANRIGDYALRALQEVEASGQVIISAEEVARDVVRQRLIDETTAEQANQLIIESEREARESFGPEQITEIRTKLDATYHGDGTYTRLRRKTELEMRDTITAQLIEEEHARIQAELDEPALHEKMVAEECTKLEMQGTFTKLKTDLLDEAYTRWKKEAELQATADITEEVEAGRDAFVTNYIAEWKESTAGKRVHAQAKLRTAEKWRTASEEVVAQELNDQETLELLRGKNEKAKEALLQDKVDATLLTTFARGGLDTMTVPKESLLTIRLGELKNDGFGYSNGYRVSNLSHLVCNRVLTFTALGEGRYMVNDDTLSSAENRYERAAALKAGEVVQIGRQRIEKKTTTLDSRLAQGVPLSYMTDDGTITNAEYDMVDIAINGQFARKDIEKVTLPNSK